MTSDELKAICEMTVELTKLRQNGCKHLCIENFAPELFRMLLQEFANNSVRSGDRSASETYRRTTMQTRMRR